MRRGGGAFRLPAERLTLGTKSLRRRLASGSPLDMGAGNTPPGPQEEPIFIVTLLSKRQQVVSPAGGTHAGSP